MEGRVEFRAEGLRQALQDAGERAEDLTPLMDAIGSHLVGAAQKRIDTTNVSPEGVAWPKSLRATLAGGGPTLYDTGRLRESITHAPSAREVEIGSNLIYAAIHQFGGDIVPKSAGALFFTLANGATVMAGKVTIPARPYLGISTEDETVIGDLVALQLTGAFDDVV